MGGSCVLEFSIFLVVVICAKAWGTSWVHFLPNQNQGSKV
jgi:hypothetical protein